MNSTSSLWPSLSLLATFCLALALGLYLTPIVRRAALRFGVLDKPDGQLKTQDGAVAYLGGIAVYLAFLLTLSLTFEFRQQFLGLLLGGTLMVMMGLFDDMRVLPARLKLLGQILAAWVVIKSGIFIELVILPPWLIMPLTFLWLVGVTNATNILDVSDGLATSTSALSATALFLVAVLNGDLLIATTALALAGALVGFLRYNRFPAKIYLGDAGSLFVGFMLAALAMIGAYTQRHSLGALTPVFILITPILETTLVSIARLARGLSPLTGSADHMAHRLKERGYSTRQVAYFGCALTIFGCSTGFGLMLLPQDLAQLLVALACTLFLAVLFWLWRACPSPAEKLARQALQHSS